MFSGEFIRLNRWVNTPFSDYSTWGLHDELGDNVHLSEALAVAALDRLLEWKRDHGLTYDVFHLDAFWFDSEKGFDDFHPVLWPNGPKPLLDRLHAEGMSMGL